MLLVNNIRVRNFRRFAINLKFNNEKFANYENACCDLTTLTYIELARACVVLLGVVDRRGRYNRTIFSAVGTASA